MSSNFEELVAKIKTAKKFILTTHKHCDGDGLGAEIAMFHALRAMGKDVRILHVDEIPKKYDFLNASKFIQAFEGQHDNIQKTDLALIFDTNDSRLIQPLFDNLRKQCHEIFFIDHHPVLAQGPAPTQGSFIDTKAASTGEIAFNIIKALGVQLTSEIARAIYTSIVFDTHIFRYIRGSTRSHEIAMELLQFEKRPSEIHRSLFATYTVEKMSFLAKCLNQIEYAYGGQLAILRLGAEEMALHNLEHDQSRDVVDLLMNIDSLQAAAVFREDAPRAYKLSLRSKGFVEILPLAEIMGGGGHVFAAGAYLQGHYEELRSRLVREFGKLLIRENIKTDESA